jgi:hypothetical protein
MGLCFCFVLFFFLEQIPGEVFMLPKDGKAGGTAECKLKTITFKGKSCPALSLPA